jgi:hypothetical protein
MIVRHCDGKKLYVTLRSVAFSYPKKAGLILLAPMKQLVGVHSIMPRHDGHRLARRKRSFNYPALFFVRPVSPDARNGLKRPFHQALSADQLNASPQEKLLFSTTLCTGGQKTTLTLIIHPSIFKPD